MYKWMMSLIASVKATETITRENQKKLIIRYSLLISIGIMLTIIAFRVSAWVRDASAANSFYLANSALGILLFLISLNFNETNHGKAARILFLFNAYYLCLTTYPIRNVDQLLLYFSLPTAVAAFIDQPRSSLKFALASTLGFVALYFVYFQGTPFPFFSNLILFVIAAISTLVSEIILTMNDQLTDAYDSTIKGWSEALEMRNQETEGHSIRVADLTLRLIKHMRVNPAQWDHIYRGVLLHDIGKMGIPDAILCKPGPLAPEEMKVMQSHPLYAQQLLSGIPYLKPALPIPYCHHEKWNGNGYPRGLKGEEIPLEARIFTVIDVWDAMRSERSYRPAIAENQVIEYLKSESGRSFDPQVVTAFFEMMGYELPDSEYTHQSAVNPANVRVKA
jgi:HD-GYP domain-containing protein (c-di-GMP phosphodiesterase class II)